MKRIIAMLLVLSLTLGLAPVGASAHEIPSIERIEFEQPGITVNTQSRTAGFSTNYTLTGDGASDMVAIALAQEGRTGSDFGYTEDWCANFISDCAILAGQSDAVPQYGIVSGLYSRIISAGGTVTTSSPKPGDLCFIDWNKGSSMGHVEIVYAVSGTTVYTIGGNSGSGSLYTRFVKKHAPLSSSYIVSIVRPAYSGHATATLDISGYLDGVDQGSLNNYGTFDVWVNGSLVADNVNDYCAALPVGTSYEITDIQASTIHKYLGLREGSLSGTVGSGASNVRLQFRTLDSIGDDFYAYIINKSTNRCAYNQLDNNATGQPMMDFIDEIWHFDRLEDGTYQITSARNGWSLDVASYGNTAGTNVCMMPYSGNTAQRWCIFEENGWCTLSAVCTPCVLYEDSATTNLQMMNDTGSDAQWFSISKIAAAYTYDVNANINGTEVRGSEDYGTFDVWINGAQVADNVTDFTQSLSIGTTYEIRDIKVNDGCSYNGVAVGTLSGTIYASSARTVLDFSDVQFDTIGTPADEVVLNGRKYAYYPSQVTWYTAKAFCEEMGGHLVTITSEEENNLVNSLSRGADAWIGATDASNEGSWEWITGEPFTYTYWWPDEPNNTPSRYDLFENYAYTTDGGWNDIYGCAKYGFVLEAESPAVLAQGTSGSTTWALTYDGTLTFSGSGKMKNYEYKSEMPWYSYLDQITSVVIEKGVASIGSYAFYGMPNLESITIPEGVTSIGDYAFKNCPVLDNVVLPTTLTQLGESAFYACTGLTSIEIPAKLYTVKPYTFKNCTALASVTFHEGNLQKISDGAFYNTALTEVSFPDCLGIIDVYAFKNCSKLAAITLGSGLAQIREAVFYGAAIPTIEIPEGVTSVGPYAFKNCVNLVSIDLPESLTSVGESSFYACTALKSLDLPDAVTKIGNYAFRKCAALAEVSFGSSLVNIGESSFYGCKSLIYLNIPEGVTTIQGYAFKGCTNLEIAELPDSLVTLGDSAFHTCTNLSDVTIPANVTKIGEYCFSGSTDIRTITFEGSAPTIGSGAFNKLTATAYYPSSNSTWTASVRQNYGGTITWTAQ